MISLLIINQAIIIQKLWNSLLAWYKYWPITNQKLWYGNVKDIFEIIKKHWFESFIFKLIFSNHGQISWNKKKTILEEFKKENILLSI